MKSQRLKSLVVATLAVIMAGSILAGCRPTESSPAPATGDKSADTASGPDRSAYKFTYYFNYDWWDISAKWGDDKTSAEMKKMFNIDIEFAKPDSDPAAKLNTMVAADDLPDAIMMDRGEDNVKLAKMGKLIQLDPLAAKYPEFTKNLDTTTQKLLAIEGKLYGVPNWSRKPTSMTGGNGGFLYNKKVYEAVGSPKLETLDDIYNYLKAVKEKGIKVDGKEINPMQFEVLDRMYEMIYRSHGGAWIGWYTHLDGKIQYAFKDQKMVDTILYLNKLMREGLMNKDVFAEKAEQVAEKTAGGRIGMFTGHFPGMLQDNQGARNLLIEQDPDNDYVVIEYPTQGITRDQYYGDGSGSVGWNVTAITNKAEKPERIFEWLTFMLTPEGSRLQTYGPKGELYDELDEKGYPVLKKFDSDLTEAERNALGIWKWNIPGQADNVDAMKYAVNNQMPEEKRNWVSTVQEKYLMPYMWCSDEFTGLDLSVDKKSREGINRDRIEEERKKQIPNAIMAGSEEEARKIIKDLVDFADKNGVAAIEEAYTKAWQNNVNLIGKSYLKK